MCAKGLKCLVQSMVMMEYMSISLSQVGDATIAALSCVKKQGDTMCTFVKVGDRDIPCITTITGEFAWKITDALYILDAYKKENRIVLGGDVLDSNLDYTCDNWYYEPDPDKSREENVIASYTSGYNYLSDYMRLNGEDYWIVLVIKRKTGLDSME